MKKYDNIPGFPGYYISKRGHLWSRYSKGVLSTVWNKKKFYLSSTIIKRLNLKLSSPGISRIWKRYQMGYYDEVLKL